MSDDSFYAGYQETLREMEDRYHETEQQIEGALRQAVDAEEARILEDLQVLLDEPALASVRAFRRELEAIEQQALLPAPDSSEAPDVVDVLAAPATAVRRLEDLDVRSMHTLARLDSTLRHSVVEDCLMNLRTFAEALQTQERNAELREKLEQQIGHLPRVAQKVVDFFSKPRFFGLAIKDVLPSVYRVALAGVKGLLWLVRRSPRGPEEAPEVPGREITARVDRLLDALGEMRREIDGRRVALATIATRARDALASLIDTAGATVEVVDHTLGGARLFVDEAALVDALAELVRNAVKYGGPAERITVVIEEEPPPSTEVRLSVSAGGQGYPAEILERPGERGLSTTGGGEGLSLVREAAEAHFGRLELANPKTGGARATIVLPRRPHLLPDRVDR